MEREVKGLNRNTRKFISIPDMDKWEQIDKLATLEKYKKSFNKIINEALDYGLPMLIKAEFGYIDEEDYYTSEEPTVAQYSQKEIDMYYRLDELLEEIIFLIEEVFLNVTINKAVICSLFNAKIKEVNGKPIPPKSFVCGDYRDTPEFMEKYELRYLKDLEKRRNKNN